MKKAEGMMLGSIAVNNTEQGAKEGQHGIRVKVWNGQPATQPSSVWFRSPKDARAAFKEQVERLEVPKEDLSWLELVSRNMDKLLMNAS